jgi:hypothetical protein
MRDAKICYSGHICLRMFLPIAATCTCCWIMYVDTNDLPIGQNCTQWACVLLLSRTQLHGIIRSLEISTVIYRPSRHHVPEKLYQTLRQVVFPHF